MIQNGTGSVAGNAQNIPEAHTPRTYSTFDLKAHRFNTERFGEYTPIFAFESVKEDKLPVRLAHNLMSYIMSAPLMQDLSKYKELFAVPMEAILPLNWEKFYDNPVRGDDVSSDVGPTVENFWNKSGTLMQALLTALRGSSVLGSGTPNGATCLQAVLRFLIFGEYFYSNGALMSYLGCHGAPYVEITLGSLNDRLSWDTFFDATISVISQYISRFTLQDITNSSTYVVEFTDNYDEYELRIPIRHALALMRDDPTCYVDTINSYVGGESASSFATKMLDLIGGTGANSYSFNFVKANIPFNTQFLSAYQLCCAHYMTNDHIDFVYSAELYRQLIQNYMATTSVVQYFTRNGLQYRYDSLSAHNMDYLFGLASSSQSMIGWLTVAGGSSNNDKAFRNCLGYWSAIFAFRRSLKYMDYFSGSRNAPLAVGSTDVNVVSNQVSVIDITRNIQKQRFLNSVNRIAHSFEGYLKGLFGGSMPAPDYHNPFDLARTVDSVFGDQTNNTVSEQMTDAIAITTNLRANSNNYMFEVQSDRPCVIIAITYYDIPRVHLRTTDRSFFHVDRFDYFNPFFQYTGDQQVYLQELGTQSFLTTSFQNFGYQLKYGELKQLFNSCAGGFVENLPGFMFPARDRRGTNWRINPDYIRSICSEFDAFYNSLSGYSCGTYFHFIVDNFIDFSGTRPMSYSPQILG